jgi:Phage integrase family
MAGVIECLRCHEIAGQKQQLMDVRWYGGQPRPTSAASSGCRDSWSSCSPSTSPTDPTARRISCSPPQGGPLRERKFLHGQLKPAARRAGLPGTLRAHDLRHTAASLLIREGASVKAVQRSLGHKSAVMTLDRYGHLWPDELEDLAERLDRARAAAVAPSTRPIGGPAVVQICKGAGQ